MNRAHVGTEESTGVVSSVVLCTSKCRKTSCSFILWLHIGQAVSPSATRALVQSIGQSQRVHTLGWYLLTWSSSTKWFRSDINFSFCERSFLRWVWGKPSSTRSPNESSKFLLPFAFKISKAGGRWGFPDRINAGLAIWNTSTSSSTVQFLLSLSSWSGARHKGHFPSVVRQRRMHKEQKVCEQDVIIGVS